MAEHAVYKLKGKTGIHAIKVNQDQIDEIRSAFELFIPDKQSTVKPVEMLRVFEKVGVDDRTRSIYEMVKSLDDAYNNELGLTFDEFIDHAANYFNERSSHEGISRIFRLFDFSDKGVLTR